jgi:hypothetical protein
MATLADGKGTYPAKIDRLISTLASVALLAQS